MTAIIIGELQQSDPMSIPIVFLRMEASEKLYETKVS